MSWRWRQDRSYSPPVHKARRRAFCSPFDPKASPDRRLSQPKPTLWPVPTALRGPPPRQPNPPLRPDAGQAACLPTNRVPPPEAPICAPSAWCRLRPETGPQEFLASRSWPWDCLPQRCGGRPRAAHSQSPTLCPSKPPRWACPLSAPWHPSRPVQSCAAKRATASPPQRSPPPRQIASARSPADPSRPRNPSCPR